MSRFQSNDDRRLWIFFASSCVGSHRVVPEPLQKIRTVHTKPFWCKHWYSYGYPKDVTNFGTKCSERLRRSKTQSCIDITITGSMIAKNKSEEVFSKRKQ